jgi:nucleoside-diphosphate-sugar epimerase
MIHHHHATPVPPSRVVVLGASGFVGGDLVRHLKTQGIPTVACSSRSLNLERPEAVEALREQVREDDALVFVSALTPDRGKDVRTLMRNLTMGQHVAAFLEKSRCGHAVYLSSDAVYDDAANPVRETSSCNPAGFHGLMHLVRERMLAPAAQQQKTPFLILRPSLLYGRADTHNGYGPNRFLRTAAQEGKITLFGQGEEQRDHVYIEDVSRLIGLSLAHRSAGVLDIATGESASFQEVAQTVARALRVDVRIECLPRSTPITHRHFDITLTRKAFPAFRYTALAAGIANCLKESAAAHAA